MAVLSQARDVPEERVVDHSESPTASYDVTTVAFHLCGRRGTTRWSRVIARGDGLFLLVHPEPAGAELLGQGGEQTTVDQTWIVSETDSISIGPRSFSTSQACSDGHERRTL